MRINIPNFFEIEGNSIEELELLAVLASDLREKYGSKIQAPIPNALGKRVAVASTANVDKFNSFSPVRFRFSKEEIEQYGNSNEGREQAAIARLVAMGEEPIMEGMGASVGSEPPVSVDTDDESFV